MSIKLGNTGINKLYLGDTQVNKAYLGDTLVFGGDSAPLYDNAKMYTLIQPQMTTLWTQGVIRLRRSSDNEQMYVFFDTNGKISLSSFTNFLSSTPSATTLGTWVGSDDAFVNLRLQIDNTNTVSASVGQGNASLQPQFISNGVIITKNGEPQIQGTGTQYLTGTANTDLDAGNDFTILSVNNNNAASNGGVLSTNVTGGGGGNSRIVMFNERGVNKRIGKIENTSAVSFNLEYIAQADTSDQKLLTITNNGFDIEGYYNGVSQDTNTWSGTYINDGLNIGSQLGASNALNGGVQELIMFPSDKTPDLTALHNDINSKYNIY